MQPPANFCSVNRKLDIYIIILNFSMCVFIHVKFSITFVNVCIIVVLNNLRGVWLQIELTMKAGAVTEETGPCWYKMVCYRRKF